MRKSRYEIERDRRIKSESMAAAAPINAAIAKVLVALMPVAKEANEHIQKLVPNGRIELVVFRLGKRVEDTLAIKGNLGDSSGPFTLVTISADSERLTAKFAFATEPVETSLEQLSRTIQRFAHSEELV